MIKIISNQFFDQEHKFEITNDYVRVEDCIFDGNVDVYCGATVIFTGCRFYGYCTLNVMSASNVELNHCDFTVGPMPESLKIIGSIMRGAVITETIR